MINADKLTFIYSTVNESGEAVGDEKVLAAVSNVDFNIEKGQFVVILGRNGSGKSTLAKLMNALYLPTKGAVYVNGVNTRNEEMLWDIRRNIGMIFQNPDNQIVATLVEDDVAFGLENLGVPQNEIRRRVDEAIKTVGMTEYAMHSPYMLSGGQKQRVAIAGIIAMRPSCIVLDEPTAMLDPRGRAEVMETIKMLNKQEGISIVLITHFVDEAVDADKVFVMDDGQIKMCGTPKEVISDYAQMRHLGLEIPIAAEIAGLLRNGGMDIKEDIINTDELVECLCR